MLRLLTLFRSQLHFSYVSEFQIIYKWLLFLLSRTATRTGTCVLVFLFLVFFR